MTMAMVIGPEYNSCRGMVVFYSNTITAPSTVVSGGFENTVSGMSSAVSGGAYTIVSDIVLPCWVATRTKPLVHTLQCRVGMVMWHRPMIRQFLEAIRTKSAVATIMKLIGQCNWGDQCTLLHNSHHEVPTQANSHSNNRR